MLKYPANTYTKSTRLFCPSIVIWWGTHRYNGAVERALLAHTRGHTPQSQVTVYMSALLCEPPPPATPTARYSHTAAAAAPHPLILSTHSPSLVSDREGATINFTRTISNQRDCPIVPLCYRTIIKCRSNYLITHITKSSSLTR